MKSKKRSKGAWLAGVDVGLKSEVLDIQGKTVRNALASLRFKGVKDVRVGKHFWLLLSGGMPEGAVRREVTKIAEKVLANPVIETFSFTLKRSGRS